MPRGSKGRSEVRCTPLYSLSSLLGTAFSLSSRVCSWGYFLSLALWWETPAYTSKWGRVVCGLGGLAATCGRCPGKDQCAQHGSVLSQDRPHPPA